MPGCLPTTSTHGELDPDDRRRLARVLPEMTDWPLNVLTPADDTWAFATGRSSTPNAAPWFGLEPCDGAPMSEVLVVDDLDLLTLASAARRAARPADLGAAAPDRASSSPSLRNWYSTGACVRRPSCATAKSSCDFSAPDMQPRLDHGLTDHPRAGEADLRRPPPP